MELPPIPHFRFLHPSLRGRVPFEEAELKRPVPQSRPVEGKQNSSNVTYGTYLTAVRFFIEENWPQFVRLLNDLFPMEGDAVSGIDIVAEKHGSEYHPARVVVCGASWRTSFVINVAMNERGRDRLTGDFQLLQELGSQFPLRFVPAAHFLGEVSVRRDDDSRINFAMFVAEWLEGFHEFHLSLDEVLGTLTTVVWNTDVGYRILPLEECASLYRQAAFILTYYYDPDSFREVFPWHHAAGDFVVSQFDGGVRVKLITVRNYASRFDHGAFENRLQALMLFVANLTIRMRLDRLDGVGNLAWAEDYCVDATIRGVFDGLASKVLHGLCDAALVDAFFVAVAGMSPEDVAGLFIEAIAWYDDDTPDVQLIEDHLADHILLVYRSFQSAGRAAP